MSEIAEYTASGNAFEVATPTLIVDALKAVAGHPPDEMFAARLKAYRISLAKRR